MPCFVGHFPVGSDAVGLDGHGVDLTASEQQRSAAVQDDAVRDACPTQLPAGDAHTLTARPGPADPDVQLRACPVHVLHDRERRAPVDEGEPPALQWVRMRRGRLVLWCSCRHSEPWRPLASPAAASATRCAQAAARTASRRAGPPFWDGRVDGVDGMGEVDGGGTRGAQPPQRLLALFALGGRRPVMPRQSRADRGEAPDAAHPAHHHLADGLGALVGQ